MIWWINNQSHLAQICGQTYQDAWEQFLRGEGAQLMSGKAIVAF